MFVTLDLHSSREQCVHVDVYVYVRTPSHLFRGHDQGPPAVHVGAVDVLLENFGALLAPSREALLDDLFLVENDSVYECVYHDGALLGQLRRGRLWNHVLVVSLEVVLPLLYNSASCGFLRERVCS